MSFSRKRTALACTYCRHRKRRCDAGKPTCSNCLESEVDCIYDDAPSQRIDTSGGSREILNRLKDIENILEAQAEGIAALSAAAAEARQHPPAVDLGAAVSPQSHGSGARTFSHSLPTRSALSPWQMEDYTIHQDVSSLPPLTIPVKHKTSSNYLLSLPAMRSLVGEYPADLFFQMESRHPLPPELSFDGTPSFRLPIQFDDHSVPRSLAATFFATAHLSHPILDEEDFEPMFNEFLERGPDASVQSALCLVVCAVGAAAAATPDELSNLSLSPPGMEYMQQALPTLVSQSSWSFSYGIQLPQALVLASIYFAYIVRPLQSWRMIYSASTILQFKLSGLGTPRDNSTSSIESILRLFWSCFLVECDRLAELELPRSGIQQLTDETSLPNCTKLGELESTCYLAEISIRRLLNRIHNSIYPKKDHVLTLSSTTLMTREAFTAEEISSMSSVGDELHRQLDIWHSSIPERYRPPLGIDPIGHDRGAVLRIRYFAARHIIYRPFVLYIATNPDVPQPESFIQKAQLCIESCRFYLYNTTEILKRPSPYTWTFSLSSLGCVVVLTLASLSPELSQFVTDIDSLQTLVINNVRPWAISSLEAVVSILEDMQKKQRLLSRV